jgi:hypothetical protein
MARVVQAVSEFDHLPIALGVGEGQVFDALRTLDDMWRVHVQPLFGWEQPNFVATHADFGVCVMCIKDWPVAVYRQALDGTIEMRSEGQWVPTVETPRYEAHWYRNTIFERFFDESEHSGLDPNIVRGVVVLPRYTTEQACNLLRRPQMVDGENWIKVWGGRELWRDPLTVVAGHPRPQRKAVPRAAFERLNEYLSFECAPHAAAV